MKRSLMLLSLSAALLCLVATAQEPTTSFVEVDGEATIFAAPTHVEFLVSFTSASLAEKATAATPAAAAPAEAAPVAPAISSNAAATDAVSEAVKEFRKNLNELDLHPVEFEVSQPTTTDAAGLGVSSTARLRFGLSGFMNPDTGAALFAELCDKLAQLSGTAGGKLVGPTFEVEDKESIIRNAVTQATTNAYPIGDALALALSSRIDAVESVKVIDLTWNKPVREIAIEPNLKQIACTAKVHVTYAVHPPQP